MEVMGGAKLDLLSIQFVPPTTSCVARGLMH